VASVFAHINDVYEIERLKAALWRLSRVATLLDRLRRVRPDRDAGGDFLSLGHGTARVNGEPMGRQMVEVLNRSVQWATLGNHEFRLPSGAGARLGEAPSRPSQQRADEGPAAANTSTARRSVKACCASASSGWSPISSGRG
jgi:hypothetical protein